MSQSTIFDPSLSQKEEDLNVKAPPMKILQLADIPLKRILDLSDFVDIFNLASLSSRAYHRIQSTRANLKLDYVKWKFVSETEQSFEIGSSERFYEFHLLPRKTLTLTTVIQEKKMVKSIGWCDLKFDGMEALTKKILCMWKVTDYFLMWYLNRPVDKFIWTFSNTFRIVHMSGISLPPCTVTQEDLTYILGNLKLRTAFMNLKVVSEKNFKYTKPLEIHDLILLSPTWLHFDSVLNSKDCWNLVLCGYRPTTSDLQKFVRKCLTGGFPKLFFFAAVFDVDISKEQPEHRDMISAEYEEILRGFYNREQQPSARIQYMNQLICVPNRIIVRSVNGDEVLVFWGKRLFGLHIETAREEFDDTM